MLHKTRGIVLGFIKYGDSSIITKIYTEEFGLQTYIVNSVRSKNSKTRIALFQPLTVLDMVVYHKENRDINRLSEVRCHTVFRSIPFEQKKISIAIFMAEVLGRTLKEHYPNKELFELITHTLSYLDVVSEHYENMHLQFMLQLSAYLGFMPSTAEDIIQEVKINLGQEEKAVLEKIMHAGPDEYIPMNNLTRRQLLDCILRYYSIHVENFGMLNSVAVLQEVLG